MKRFTVLVTLLLFSLVTVQLVTGCTNNTRTRSVSEVSPPFHMNIPGSGVNPHHDEIPIKVYWIVIEPSSVTCSGKADLPDGTILHSQLYEGDIALSWWPADMDIIVQNGLWDYTVTLERTGRTKTIFFTTIYHYKIWQEDNQVNNADGFFGTGDPPLTPWWKQGTLWLVTGITAGVVAITTGVYAIVRRGRRV